MKCRPLPKSKEVEQSPLLFMYRRRRNEYKLDINDKLDDRNINKALGQVIKVKQLIQVSQNAVGEEEKKADQINSVEV